MTEKGVTEDLGYGWQGDLIDLPAYLKRVGYDGGLAPDTATLRALHRAHVTSIPFENLEIMLGRGIDLSLDTVQAKLVTGTRGGYCFEHARLFAGVLEHLGFEVTALTGRVTMGNPKLLPGTHALLHVRTRDDGPDEPGWLCDMGFGSGPLEPLRFRDGEEAEQDGWGYRLRRTEPATHWTRGASSWELLQRDAEGWLQRHTFTTNEAFRIDFDVLSHFVATSPRSPFTRRPFTQRFTGAVHRVLDGTTLTSTRPDGGTEVRELTPEDLPETLATLFDIVVDAEDVPRLIESARP